MFTWRGFFNFAGLGRRAFQKVKPITAVILVTVAATRPDSDAEVLDGQHASLRYEVIHRQEADFGLCYRDANLRCRGNDLRAML